MEIRGSGDIWKSGIKTAYMEPDASSPRILALPVRMIGFHLFMSKRILKQAMLDKIPASLLGKGYPS